MNINITVKCATCGEPTNCRIGLSVRYERPLRFSCQDCGSPIDIFLADPKGAMLGKSRPKIEGAVQVPSSTPFDSDTNFVDLHQDFPVSFGKYVMGMTPFMMASRRIEFEALQLHGSRLAQLDEQHGQVRDFTNLLKLYAKDRIAPFKLNVERVFKIHVKSDLPQDINAALYRLIADVMAPFAFPGQNEDVVEHYNQMLFNLTSEEPLRQALFDFVNDVVSSGFLKKTQLDCLEIYPKIIDDEYAKYPLALRVSVDEFSTYKDLYKDITEIISRQMILVAGVNNIMKRGDFNTFLPGIGKTVRADRTPKSLAEYAGVNFGLKLNYIDETWFEFVDGAADNQLRNAIAHYKTDYNDVTQEIYYFPRREGMEEKKYESIYFIEFMKRILIAYREMHRLHHLIKALFYLKFLLIDRIGDSAG